MCTVMMAELAAGPHLSHRSRFDALLIAAVAHANQRYTRDPGDFVGLDDLLTIVLV